MGAVRFALGSSISLYTLSDLASSCIPFASLISFRSFISPASAKFSAFRYTFEGVIGKKHGRNIISLILITPSNDARNTPFFPAFFICPRRPLTVFSIAPSYRAASSCVWNISFTKTVCPLISDGYPMSFSFFIIRGCPPISHCTPFAAILKFLSLLNFLRMVKLVPGGCVGA
ncbi:hypothetical protein NEPAR07_0622 [Nematocida parisii]|nr:hypothetical protein NEPAR07_0622 [Nematocida parisii]